MNKQRKYVSYSVRNTKYLIIYLYLVYFIYFLRGQGVLIKTIQNSFFFFGQMLSFYLKYQLYSYINLHSTFLETYTVPQQYTEAATCTDIDLQADMSEMSDKSVGGYDGEGVYTRLYIVYRAVRIKKVIDASTRFI